MAANREDKSASLPKVSYSVSIVECQCMTPIITEFNLNIS